MKKNMEEKTEIYLPDECWEQIIDRLTVNQIHVVSLISKSFLSFSNRLVSRLRIRGTSLAPAHLHDATSLSKILKRFHRVKRITISNCQSTLQLNSIILDVCRSRLDLEELVLANPFKDLIDAYGNPIRDSPSATCYTIAVDGLRELGLTMKKLRVLTLRMPPDCLTANEFMFIADCFPQLQEFGGWDTFLKLDASTLHRKGFVDFLARKFKGLRKLIIDQKSTMTDDGLIDISNNCLMLSEVSIPHRPAFITQKGICSLLRNSAHLDCLHLSIQDFIIPSSDFRDSISCAKSLRDLGLFFMAVSDDMLGLIANANLPALMKFSLSWCEGFTYFGLSSFLHKYHSSITHLSLSRVDILDDQLMNVLSSTCLQHLMCVSILSDNQFTDSIIFILATNCPLLRKMNISGRFNHRTAEKPPLLPKKNYNVRSLNLGAGIHVENVITLALACPNLQELTVYHHMHDDNNNETDTVIEDVLKGCSKLKRVKVGGVNRILRPDSDVLRLELESLDIVTCLDFDDNALEAIAIRCPKLMELSICCKKVTATGLKKLLENCKMIENLQLKNLGSLDFGILLETLVVSKPALRKIVVPGNFLPNEELRRLFLLNGCLITL